MRQKIKKKTKRGKGVRKNVSETEGKERKERKTAQRNGKGTGDRIRRNEEREM